MSAAKDLIFTLIFLVASLAATGFAVANDPPLSEAPAPPDPQVSTAARPRKAETGCLTREQQRAAIASHKAIPLGGALSGIQRVHALSPDGRTLLYAHGTRPEEQAVAIRDVERRTGEVLQPKGARLSSSSFSANGRRMAAVRLALLTPALRASPSFANRVGA